ncbi:MAG: hypothetical protein Q9163_002880 [Psora crenata]
MPPQDVQASSGQQGRGTSSRIQTALQSIAIFFAVQFVISQFFSSKTATQQGVSVKAPSTVPAWEHKPDAPVTNYNPNPQVIAPIWPSNSSLDLAIYVSSSLLMPSLSFAKPQQLVLWEQNFTLGNWEDTRNIGTVLEVPKEVQNNGTWWAHFYVGLHGHTLDPEASSYDSTKAYRFARPLNQILPKKKVAKKKNLLSGPEHDQTLQQEELDMPAFGSYYHPNFTMSFIPDSGVQNYGAMHPAVRQHVHLESTGARDESGQNGWYYPILFVNTFWQLRDHMTELNSTVKEVPLHITINNMKNWKMAIYASIDEGMKQNQRQAASGGPMPAAGDGSEFEEFKRVLIDTNIYLLSTTAVVSVLHMVFEALAFKSDISHWRHKKDNVGISVRTIFANVFMQTVIFLYLMDNSDGTSWMILLGQGMGILLEAWKITKTVDVRVRPAGQGSWLPYKVTFEDKHKLSETEEKTKEYDEIAFRYLYLVAIPLLGAYAVYSLIYESHKSWYSFIITTLVGSVYAYGFLMMVPSLYINYRLKSVAHMPARAMTYKFLNTFIDDLFAFTIKMPTLHRLATLRDDVIFFVYLYQSYVYRVDYSRVNEFGQGGDEEGSEEKIANRPLTAPPEADAESDQDGGIAQKATGTQKLSAKKRRETRNEWNMTSPTPAYQSFVAEWEMDSPTPTYESLVTEYRTLMGCHKASVLAARSAKRQFVAADAAELRHLKRSINSYERLTDYSDAYRTHRRYVNRLSSRLLSWNHDINTRARGQELDEVEGLRYYSTCYEYLTATSQLVQMNSSGQMARVRTEVLYNRVQRAKAWKVTCDQAGKDAYGLQNHLTEQAALFLAKLEKFTYDGPPRPDALVKRMEQWMDEIEERIREAGQCEDAKGEWVTVKDGKLVHGIGKPKQWIGKEDGERRRAIEEEEELMKGLETLKEKFKRPTWGDVVPKEMTDTSDFPINRCDPSTKPVFGGSQPHRLTPRRRIADRKLAAVTTAMGMLSGWLIIALATDVKQKTLIEKKRLRRAFVLALFQKK